MGSERHQSLVIAFEHPGGTTVNETTLAACCAVCTLTVWTLKRNLSEVDTLLVVNDGRAQIRLLILNLNLPLFAENDRSSESCTGRQHRIGN